MSFARRYVVLTALRWLSVGVQLPVTVLLMDSRGLSVGEIGAMWAVHGVTVAALELPTGGLADVFGRRVVWISSCLLGVLASLGIALAGSFALFVAAFAVQGAARALSSGPLEAWYVDAEQALDPAADLRPGLSHGHAAESGGLGAGALLGGLLPLAFGGLAVNATVSPLGAAMLVAAGLGVLTLVAAAVLMNEPPRDRAVASPNVRASLAGGLTVGVRSPAARRLLASCALFGAILTVLEVLTPGRFAELLGDAKEATAVYGSLVAIAFLLLAGTTAATPALARHLGTTSSLIAPLGIGALALAILGADSPLLVTAVAYIVAYAGFGPWGVLVYEAMHHRTAARERATMLSVLSLVQQAGGALGALGLAAAAGFGTLPIWLAAASAAVLAGGLAAAGVGRMQPSPA